jgi:hypothetical protein
MSNTSSKMKLINTGDDEQTIIMGVPADREFYVQFPDSASWDGTNSNDMLLRIRRKIHHGSAAPTTGTWERGDIFFDSSPTSGGKIGWVCTTAGTPGTWKAWGVID